MQQVLGYRTQLLRETACFCSPKNMCLLWWMYCQAHCEMCFYIFIPVFLHNTVSTSTSGAWEYFVAFYRQCLSDLDSSYRLFELHCSLFARKLVHDTSWRVDVLLSVRTLQNPRMRYRSLTFLCISVAGYTQKLTFCLFLTPFGFMFGPKQHSLGGPNTTECYFRRKAGYFFIDLRENRPSVFNFSHAASADTFT